jgi:hypothetical protein
MPTLSDMAKVSIRVPDPDLIEIDRRAHRSGMTRSAFILKTALDRATGDERQFEEINERLRRLEESRDASGWG